MNARVWQLTYAVPFEHGTEVDLNDWGTEQLTSLAPQPAFRNVFHRYSNLAQRLAIAVELASVA